MKSSFLYQEIQEQPEVITQLISTQRTAMLLLAAEIKGRAINHVVIAARGTSDNAGRYAKYVFGARNQMTVSLAAPSLFSLYKRPPSLERAFVLGISQSGQSPDIVAVLAEAKRQGSLTAAFTNELDSPLAKMADHVISLSAGDEHAVAATKTYTAELAAIALLSDVLLGEYEKSTELEQLPQLMRETLSLAQGVPEAVERYRYMKQTVVIGRGFNYSTAFELALKLKELTYTYAEPYSSADFRHGPMAIIESGFPVILVAPTGELSAKLFEFQHLLLAKGAELITISDDQKLLQSARTKLRLPLNVPEWLSPLVSVIPGQMFALSLAYTKGYDVDAPRGITKVTETY